MLITGSDNGSVTQQEGHISVANNQFYDLNGVTYAGPTASTCFLKIVSNGSMGTDSVTIDHNTANQTGNIASTDGNSGAAPHTNFVYTNNVTPHGGYGFTGASLTEGTATLNALFPGYTFRRNVIAGTDQYGNNWSRFYPADNFFPNSFDSVGFADYVDYDFRLASSSPYKNQGTDGKDVGADASAINSALGGNLIDTDQRVFVRHLYLDALTREPDISGLLFWTGQVSATSRGDVARGFFYSSEFVSLHPALAFGSRGTLSYNQEFVRQCYYVFLKRYPQQDPQTQDPNGFNFWVGTLPTDPNTPNIDSYYTNVLNAFVLSSEYRARFGIPQ